MLELWQRRSLTILSNAGNRTLMLFSAEFKLRSGLEIIEPARCFGKFSSQVAFEKELDAADVIKSDVA